MDNIFTSSDHRAITIATERIAKLDPRPVGYGQLKFYYGTTPSGRTLQISIGERWVEIEAYPVVNGHTEWSATPKVYAHHRASTEDHSEIDKALAILRWLGDLKWNKAAEHGYDQDPNFWITDLVEELPFT